MHVTMVNCEANSRAEMAELFLTYGAKGYVKTYELENYDNNLILSSEYQIIKEDDLEKLAERLENMSDGEEDYIYLSTMEKVILIKE